MKKIVLSLLIMVLVCGLFSFAYAKTFSDVLNTKFSEAVDILSTLKIVDGYQDGTYKPDNSVKRSELCKLLIVALDQEDLANSLKSKSDFPDVKDDNWAVPYINAASRLGLIKGYTDGSFKPEKTVTYAEASTMMLRALNYNKELENKKYPTEYMATANTAGILNGVKAGSSSEAASRGNIANMILNTLKGSVRKIVSTSSTGAINYGNGGSLLESSFSDLIFVSNGLVDDIDFEESKLIVKDKVNDRKITVAFDGDEEDLKELFGREISFIYDKKKPELMSFEVVDKKTVEVYDIDEIEDDETIITSDGKEFALPSDSNILMLYINKYDEAETAYITFASAGNNSNSKKVEYVILEGTPTIYIGLVYETGLKVDGRKGFSVVLLDEDDEEEYALSDTSEKLHEDDIIVFTLDNDDFAIIKENLDVDDALKIEDLGKDYIKLHKTDKITFGSGTEYYVYMIKNNNIVEASFSDIDEEFDLATIVKFSDTYYLFVFEDAVDVDDIVSSLSVNEATELLEDAVAEAKPLTKKETSYSVASFAELVEAYDDAKSVLKTATSAARLELAARRLNDAIENLDSKVSSEDKKLRSLYEDLEDLIEKAEAKKEADYTTASYRKLTSELNKAKAIKLSTTTVSKLEDRVDALEEAILMLVTTEADKERTDAGNRLNTLITKAKALKSADYTADSYKKVTDNLSSAQTVYSKRSSISVSAITNAADNLEAAINSLVKK